MMMTFDELLLRKVRSEKPIVVCICGSTRFSRAWQDAGLQETLEGRIVLSIGSVTSSDEELAKESGIVIDREMLDILHLFKIDLADEILVLNVGGYVGEATGREIEYAQRLGKPIRWWEPESAPF
jgi:hypothetical protein